MSQTQGKDIPVGLTYPLTDMTSGSLGNARTWSSTNRAKRPASLGPDTWTSWNFLGLRLLPTRMAIGPLPLLHDFRRWRCFLLLAIVVTTQVLVYA